MSPAVDIVVNAAAWEALPGLEDLAARAVEQSALVAGAKLAKDCELCIVFATTPKYAGSTRNGAGRTSRPMSSPSRPPARWRQSRCSATL